MQTTSIYRIFSQDLYPCFDHQHYDQFLELETGKPISASVHANQEIPRLCTGQSTLPPFGFGSRNGSSLVLLGQDTRDNPNCYSIGLGGSFLTQFGKGIIRTTATPVSTTVMLSSLPSPLPSRKKTVWSSTRD